MKKLLTICSLALFMTMAISLNAQTSVPAIDTSFNHTGFIVLDSLRYFESTITKVLADGKILVAGYGDNDPNADLDAIIYRLNKNGTVDYNFGNGGQLMINIDTLHEIIYDIEIMPDNKILLLVESTFRTYLVRLNPDGSYDQTWGTNGFKYVPTAVDETATIMLRQADEKILILSSKLTQSGIFIGTVRRCLPNGDLDTGYGTNGSLDVVVDLSFHFTPTDAVLQPDGKLVFTGELGLAQYSSYPVVRLNTDGSFDNTFSGDGIYTKVLGVVGNNYSATATSIVLANDGKIIVGGQAPYQGTMAMTAIAVNPNGTAVGSFGTLGVARILVGLFSQAYQMIRQPDGKLLMGGYGVNANQSSCSYGMARLNTNGSIDNTFGTSGKIIIPYTGPGTFAWQTLTAMDIAPDGKLVASGYIRKTINFQDASPLITTVNRFLTDIVVKAEEPSLVFLDTRVSPNPVTGAAVALQYTLAEAGVVTASLYDANGMQVAQLLNDAYRAAGPVTENLNLATDIPAGVYFVELQTEKGSKVIKIVKQ